MNQNVSTAAGIENNASKVTFILNRNTSVTLQILSIGEWQRFVYCGGTIPNVSGYVIYGQKTPLFDLISVNQPLYEELFGLFSAKKYGVFGSGFSLTNRFVIHALVKETTDPDQANMIGQQVIFNLPKKVVTTEFSDIPDVHHLKSLPKLKAAMEKYIGGELFIKSFAQGEALAEYNAKWSLPAAKVKLPEFTINVNHYFNIDADDMTRQKHKLVIEEAIRRAKKAGSAFPNLASMPMPKSEVPPMDIKPSNPQFKELIKDPAVKELQAKYPAFFKCVRTTDSHSWLEQVMNIYRSGDIDDFEITIAEWCADNEARTVQSNSQPAVPQAFNNSTEHADSREMAETMDVPF